MTYDPKKQEPFTDPVVRCDSCNIIIITKALAKAGCCPKCGNRRIRNVLAMNDGEMTKLRERGIDENFIKLFEEVDENAIL